MRLTFPKSFWAKVRYTSGCWEWTGSRSQSGHGYGQISVGRKLLGAHRVSWELHNGPIPDGKLVLHRCDNRGCVRPDHLFLGTQTENIVDMVRKKRCYNAKLSPEMVIAIRELKSGGVRSQRIAALYGVTEVPVMSAQTPTDLRAGWLIWSNYHRAYWGPNGGGYSDQEGAGRYTLKDALKWCSQRSVDFTDPRSNPPELVVPSPELLAAILAEPEPAPEPDHSWFRGGVDRELLGKMVELEPLPLGHPYENHHEDRGVECALAGRCHHTAGQRKCGQPRAAHEVKR